MRRRIPTWWPHLLTRPPLPTAEQSGQPIYTNTNTNTNMNRNTNTNANTNTFKIRLSLSPQQDDPLYRTARLVQNNEVMAF